MLNPVVATGSILFFNLNENLSIIFMKIIFNMKFQEREDDGNYHKEERACNIFKAFKTAVK